MSTKSIAMHAESPLSQWPDLPPDVLREISSRLHDAKDFVRFHSVCKPWWDAAGGTATRTQSFLPWLLAPDGNNPFSISLNLRNVFSRTSYWARPPFSVRFRKWVASADSTAVWYYAEHPSPSLRDPLTGDVSLLLPPFPHEERWVKTSPWGVVYSDGTVLLYSVIKNKRRDTTKLRAALLRPGDPAWSVVDRTFRYHNLYDMYVSYYCGKILITVDTDDVLTPNEEVGIGDVLAVSRPWIQGEINNYDYIYQHSYVLESRGELLCVSIYINKDYRYAFGGKDSVFGLVRSLWVCVHALELEDESAPRWVRKDGGSLADRVLFLGWPNSFAVDASRLTGDDVVSGGCAYFVYDDSGVMPDRPCYVFRYNLVDDKAKFIERLPKWWDLDYYMWLFPQPSLAPGKENIMGRKCWKGNKPITVPTSTSNIYIDRPEQPKCYNTYFRVLVRNLPPKVDSFQLRRFFSKHGKVYNAEVLCERNNKMSKKIAFVTMAMVEEQEDALAALNGMVFNGCILEVRLVQRWKRLSSPYARMIKRGLGHLRIFIKLLLLVIVLITLLSWGWS